MKKSINKFAILFSSLLLSTVSMADDFSLNSADIAHGEFMSKAQEFEGFGCSGGNESPQLSWSNAPKGTVAFAVTAYDPDAPTGSGWWHWQIVNIPANVTSLAAGSGDQSNKLAPKGSRQIDNDYGFAGFGGACPPEGHGAHRYQFTVHALSKKLELPENASGALAGFMIKAHSLGSSSIEALYKR
ncbi:MAG: YbhB/YbcL family Raf kinase inhibitor-like protein [Gammaproteobacteria bacterium]|nr:YbhB/YbcL family Raf kinase inhibitor-like protein [Gammaproteobacteria bacterium]